VSTRAAGLTDLGAALVAAGYTVEVRDLAKERLLLAETPYALLACMEVETCDELPRRVADVQAALTQLAAAAPSPRRWDLYVLVHVRTPVTDPADQAVIETIEADTKYARKFVRVLISVDDPDSLDRALRPFLPLRPAAAFDLFEPLVALRRELLELDLPAYVADAALAAFDRDEEVVVP
jgi:hypothetical protein